MVATKNTGPIQYDDSYCNISHYMKKIYLYISFAIIVSCLSAYVFFKSGLLFGMMNVFYSSGFSAFFGNIILLVAMIFLTSAISAKMDKYSPSRLFSFFILYAALIGVSLAPLFVFCNIQDVILSFAIASAMFISMAVYGYTTDKDLTVYRSYLFMGLIGIFAASIIGWFVKSTFFHLMLSYAGVVLFTIYVAYDTQQIKARYAYASGYEMREKLIILGALHLYMDFIQLFVHILRILTLSRRD